MMQKYWSANLTDLIVVIVVITALLLPFVGIGLAIWFNNCDWLWLCTTLIFFLS